MVREIRVQVPKERGQGTFELFKSIPNAYGVSLVDGPDHCLLLCRCDVKHATAILETLTSEGIGVHYGCIDIGELMTTIPRLGHLKRNIKKTRHYRTTDRMSNEEIYQSIDKQIHLTFDYLLLLVAASMMAGAGLVQDSSAVVVASMIVSPLMAPLLGVTYGYYIADQRMLFTSGRNTLVGVGIVMATGMILGLVAFPYFLMEIRNNSDTDPDFTYLTSEMASRGNPVGLVFGLLIAVPSGLAVSVAVAGGVSSTLVGVAISAALLPPIVNSGLNLSLAFTFWMSGVHHAVQAAGIGGISFVLFIENVVAIFLSAIVMFKIKGIGPPAQESMEHNYTSVCTDQFAPPNSRIDAEPDCPPPVDAVSPLLQDKKKDEYQSINGVDKGGEDRELGVSQPRFIPPFLNRQEERRSYDAIGERASFEASV